MSNTIASEIMAIAIENGYEGAEAQTIAGAINILADTLAGEDEADGATIASAIRGLASLVGPVPSGTISITENGEDIDVAAYSKATVNVPNPSTGTLNITENGENIDVRAYAYVTVAVTAASGDEVVS